MDNEYNNVYGYFVAKAGNCSVIFDLKNGGPSLPSSAPQMPKPPVSQKPSF